MNSRPLPYQGSALPLSYASLYCILQPLVHLTANHCARSLPSTTRKAKNASSTNVSVLYFPGSIVKNADRTNTAKTPSDTTIRPVPAGLKSTTTPHCIRNRKMNGAQGRIRTSVTRRVADLQSAAINRSATCALLCHLNLDHTSNRTNRSSASNNKTQTTLSGAWLAQATKGQAAQPVTPC